MHATKGVSRETFAGRSAGTSNGFHQGLHCGLNPMNLMVATHSNLFQFFSWLRPILMTSTNLRAGGKVRSCPGW
jgi:hypothetical protein